jgi:hypothetical protein
MRSKYRFVCLHHFLSRFVVSSLILSRKFIWVSRICEQLTKVGPQPPFLYGDARTIPPLPRCFQDWIEEDLEMAGLTDELRVGIASSRLRKAIRKIEADGRENPGENLREHADDVQELIGAEFMLNAATRKERRGRGH